MKKLDFRRKELRDFLKTEIRYHGFNDMYLRFRLSAWNDGIATPEWEELEKSQLIKLKNKLLYKLANGEKNDFCKR